MHVPMEQLKAATDSFMLHVPYTGAGPAVLAVLMLQGPGGADLLLAMVRPVRARRDPEPVVARLRQAAKSAAEDSRAIQALASAGSYFQYLDKPEFERFLQADARNMAALVQRIGRVE